MLLAKSSAQTTQPYAPQAWSDLVNKVANQLTEEPAPASLRELISDDLPIREFDSNSAQSRYRLQERTSRMKIISTHTYTWPATSIAADLATDMHDNEALPEPVRKQFTPRDDSDMVRANGVAQQWISGVLQPANGDCIAVVLMWEHPATTGNPTQTLAPEAKQPLFVLLKAAKIDDDQYRIAQIAYGDAHQALN